MPKKKKRTRKVKLDPLSKPIRYLQYRLMGYPKGKAALMAGYADIYHCQQIENTKTYKEGLKAFLLDHPLVALELNKNILQDEDKNAKNRAIDMYLKLMGEYPKEESSLEIGNLKIVFKQKDETEEKSDN